MIIMWKKIKPYAISILISLGVGGLSAWVTRDNMTVFDTVEKPPLTPPAILFPIVWTILYVLMGISAARIYPNEARCPREVKSALTVYGATLFLNFMWSVIFFNFRAFLISFLWLLILWIVILIMIRRFWKIEKLSAYLQIPYLIWVTFAGYLNLAIYLLNR